MRAIDYLETRPEVDRARIGVTGISGGGAITWYTAAADERVQVLHEIMQPAIEQLVHRREKFIQWHIPHRHIQTRQTKLALERTPARGLDVNHAMRQVFIAV